MSNINRYCSEGHSKIPTPTTTRMFLQTKYGAPEIGQRYLVRFKVHKTIII